MKKMNFAKKQQGLNLIELLLVLAIVVAIAVAAFVIYPRVSAGRQATSNTQVLSAALAQVQSIFQNGQYGNLTSIVAAKSDVFPESYILDADAGEISNEFSNGTANVTVFGSNSAGGLENGNAARYVTVTYNDVPSKVCMKLVPGLAANWGRISVAGVVVQDKFASSAVPFNEGGLATQCNIGSSANLILTAR